MPGTTKSELLREKSKAKVLGHLKLKIDAIFQSSLVLWNHGKGLRICNKTDLLDANKKKVWTNIVFKCQESYFIYSNMIFNTPADL